MTMLLGKIFTRLIQKLINQNYKEVRFMFRIKSQMMMKILVDYSVSVLC